jgi:hypothetical protein
MRYEEYVNSQLTKLKKAGIVRTDEMLDLDLYIDQAEAFFKKQMGMLDSPAAERYSTKSAINTYAKHNMIARPDGKKYSKAHMVMIAMVIYFKGIFKMEDIEKLMSPLVENYNSEFDDKIDPQMLYHAACSVNAGALDAFSADIDSSISSIKKQLESDDPDLADDERMEVLTLILALAMKADMQKYMAQRLLETYFINPANERPEKFKMPKQPKEKKKTEKKPDKKAKNTTQKKGE